MTSQRTDLERECAVFCRYLTQTAPSAYLLERYVNGHVSFPATPLTTSSLDRTLLAFARLGTTATRIADTYAARFSRRGPLRCKLVLMLALVEHDAVRHHSFDHARSGGRIATLVALSATGIAWVARMALAMLLFGPMHLLSAPRKHESTRG